MKILTNIKGELPKEYCLASIDTEWTKNFKIKNGNKPFNFSIIYIKDNIDVDEIIKAKFQFKFVSVYIENENEIADLINLLNKCLNLSKIHTLLGHQVVSDLYTFLNFSETLYEVNVENIKAWISFFKDRKTNKKIFDTRYDLNDRLKSKSRRLVDVCYEMKLKNQEDLHKQPELNKSMTALQKEFMQTHSELIREKLSVMNLRHNLSTVLVYELYKNEVYLDKFINTNQILRLNLADYFDYVNSKEFGRLCNI